MFVCFVPRYLLSPRLSHSLTLYLSFTVSQNILFLSMAEFRADKGVEGSEGSDIMGFSCQIGSKSSLWAHRRAERGSRFLPDFCRGNDWGLSKPQQRPVIHWLLWYWPTVQVFTVREMHTNCACFVIYYFSFQLLGSLYLLPLKVLVHLWYIHVIHKVHMYHNRQPHSSVWLGTEKWWDIL